MIRYIINAYLIVTIISFIISILFKIYLMPTVAVAHAASIVYLFHDGGLLQAESRKLLVQHPI